MWRKPGDEADPWPPPWPELTDERVRRAMAYLPRELFVPERLRRWAYSDAPLPIGNGQTISQPFVVALMSQALEVRPGDRVLEIGTGSGYQTALLCELCAPWAWQPESGPKGSTVFSVERQAALTRRARQVLTELGYAPSLRVGDGALGWPEAAPFDAIMVTSAPVAIPRPLWQQLAEGGRMVIPVGPITQVQTLWRVEKRQGRLHGQALSEVRFVPLISPVMEDRSMWVQIGSEVDPWES